MYQSMAEHLLRHVMQRDMDNVVQQVLHHADKKNSGVVMVYLPLANIWHHKLRSLLCALGVGISICMLVALTGLARGSLFENADRWESVGADLIVFPRGWADKIANRGVGLSEKYAKLLREKHGDLVERAAGVFCWPMKVAGQDHVVAGVAPEQWDMISGGKAIKEGRLFDPENRFAKWLDDRLLSPATDDRAVEITEADLRDPEHDGLELVIDTRLAAAAGLGVGDTLHAANHDWTIVGLAPTGVMTRIFMPLRTAQFLFGDGDVTKCTMILVKLRDGVDAGPAARTLRDALKLDVIPPKAYRVTLQEHFSIMLNYVDMVNIIALIIAFLFVMNTLYTMVLERKREIAILRSCGASGWFILRQVLGESMILAAAGVVIGVAMSFGASALIGRLKPLLTPELSFHWMLIAAGAAVLGAILSALYPAWRATRINMAEVLVYE
ncbi:MAG: ABC transporter permease [Phycisphaerae bacterium]|nr:ABC transporter permease [Phycisphaerae bacterium]